MVFKTTGNKSNSVILFFHAMGVTGESSMPVAEKMAEKYYCIMPTSTVYCSGQRYQSKRDEIQQMNGYVMKEEIIFWRMELLFVRSDVKWLFRGCKSAGNIDNIIDVHTER